MESTVENRTTSFLEQHRAFLERNEKAIINYILRPVCMLVWGFGAYIIYDGSKIFSGYLRWISTGAAMVVFIIFTLYMLTEFKKTKRRTTKC